MYKWAPVSCSGVAAFHLAACVCTSSSDKELIRPVCSLMHSINSFHNRLMLHHWIISKEVINTESWSTFQFLGISSAEFRYSLFFYQYVGKTHLVSSGKNQSIWLRWLNKQLEPLIENLLVSYREVEFTETSLIANQWYVLKELDFSALESECIQMISFERTRLCTFWSNNERTNKCSGDRLHKAVCPHTLRTCTTRRQLYALCTSRRSVHSLRKSCLHQASKYRWRVT